MSVWVRLRHPGPVLKVVESLFICAAMSTDRKELLALYALGALDGDDLIVAEACVAEGEPSDLADLRAYENVTGLLGWAAEPVAPPVRLRPRVVDEIGARTLAPAPIPFQPRAGRRALSRSSPLGHRRKQRNRLRPPRNAGVHFPQLPLRSLRNPKVRRHQTARKEQSPSRMPRLSNKGQRRRSATLAVC